MSLLSKGRFLAVLCALLAGVPSLFGQASVRINEVMANNFSYVAGDGSVTDWVELYNNSDVAVDFNGQFSGASLTDDPLNPLKWVFPPGVSIPPRGYLRIALDSDRTPSFDPEPFLNAGFGVKSTGGQVLLYARDFGDAIDSVTFGLQVLDLSVGRVPSGAWKLCVPTPGAPNFEQSLGLPAGLRVNEWLANAPSGSDDWFEIINLGAQPIQLDGLFLTDRLNEPAKSPIQPLSFIGSGLAGYVKFIADGNTNKGADHALFSLAAGGEAIGIFNSSGQQIDAVAFGAQASNISEGRLPDGNAFITTFPGTASPGRSNFKSFPSLVVSELLSHTDPPFEDAVEFFNSSDAPINVGGWYLSNKESSLRRYRIPPGTTIPARGYKVFYESSFNNPNSALIPFTFNSAHGDQVYLAQADASDNLTGYRVGEEFEAAANGVSFGRVQSSVPGDYKFVAMDHPTFGVDNPSSVAQFAQGAGAPNSPPKVGPIVINEVYFNPASDDGFDNTMDEFIEFHNTSSAPVLLYDPDHSTNRWRLQNGVTFLFPASNNSFPIPAGGYALVVSFNPATDPVAAANFRAKFAVPSAVRLYGPTLKPLSNDGDAIELNRPDAPQPPDRSDAGFVPYIRVDKVNYTDRAPWPPSADGTGFSLQRKNPRTFGNDPINWDAAAPTPGRANSAALQDTDGDGMTDLWEDLYTLDKNSPADAALDSDTDGHTNLQEYLAGTHPRDAASRLRVSSIVPARSAELPLQLTFTAAPDKSYSVLYRNSFAINANWQKLRDVFAEPAGRTVTVEDPGAFSRTDRYYQIVTPRVQ